MRFAHGLALLGLFVIPALTAPAKADSRVARSPVAEDADEAIAYAWFAEDDESTSSRRSAKKDNVDADEAIAYAWFNEDDEDSSEKKRTSSRKADQDADEAIAYAWFNEDDDGKDA